MLLICRKQDHLLWFRMYPKFPVVYSSYTVFVVLWKAAEKSHGHGNIQLTLPAATNDKCCNQTLSEQRKPRASHCHSFGAIHFLRLSRYVGIIQASLLRWLGLFHNFKHTPPLTPSSDFVAHILKAFLLSFKWRRKTLGFNDSSYKDTLD